MNDSLISDLLEQLASITEREAEQEIRLVVGVSKEVRQLEGNLRTVKAVLNDAEKRQLTDNNVKLWLKKLEDVSYEIDDVLFEWNTAMIKLEIEKDEEENAENAHVVKKKVCSFIPSPPCCLRQVDKLVLRHDIAHKIKELNGKIGEIVRERRMSGFELTTRGNASKVVERPTTTSFVDVSEIYGRDKVKDDLVSILLGRDSEEERNPHVISLVGMGGIGKTTLAQLAYNDPEVKAHFDLKMWVCVSDPFDKSRVAKAIVQEIKGISYTLTGLQSLLHEIHDLTKEKKFFLVLDDVWTEDSTLWEPFRLALKNGAQGSRILVTTRKIRVAEIMGSTSASMINLEVLSEEDCWLVFRKIAFLDRDPNQCEQLEDPGRKIVEKCKGLPLAAKTLGSLMRFQRSREEWEMVLDSSLWELEDVGKVVEKDLFGPLLLSYNDLPSSLKQCFSFCAVFPKDYVFHIDDLVYMWMAHGYIDSKEHMELKGREYFENLAIRSFFQDFQEYEVGCGEELLGKLPKGIGNCISLRTLKSFDVNEECKLSELKNLNNLRGTLKIGMSGNRVTVQEAENAQLKNKIHLRTLELKKLPTENTNLLMNALEPPPNLEYLSIDSYWGGPSTTTPDWMISLNKLKMLRLMRLDVECLPSLGKLPSLETLEIRRLNSLKKVGVEFLGIEFKNKVIFSKLKHLLFLFLDKWEEWIGIEGMKEEEEDCITIMPHLQILRIHQCPNLKSLPDFLRKTPLKELTITYNPILKERCERETGEDWPKISHIPNIMIGENYVQRDGQEDNSKVISSYP
uniref:NB-ARC domain-containing protein n=1 Tax=Fagus sylvatica TaxID=28930 RepID=A0A2N9F1P4_FAGSY